MKIRNLALVTMFALAVMASAFTADAPSSQNIIDPLPIGSALPMGDKPMLDISGNMVTLNQVKGENGLLVIFSCNTCPWVKAWEDRYLVAAEQAEELGIGMIAINPNEAYRDRGDGQADNQARAEEMGYTFYYTIDENHQLADAFGASKTPDVFLFDNSMTLVYQGAIDDNARRPQDVADNYLANAMTAMVQGNAIATTTTKSIGCTIKRVE